MTTDDALQFLRNHQPLAEDAPQAVIDELEAVRLHLEATADARCIPLLLGVTGDHEGLGEFQLFDSIFRQFAIEELTPHLAVALRSPNRGVRRWAAHWAMQWPHPSLLESLFAVLDSPDDEDAHFSCLAALGILAEDSNDTRALDYLKQRFAMETDKELRQQIREIFHHIGYFQEWEVMPTGEMQKKYGMYAENYEPPQIDPEEVPYELRDLIPWAERFGISCDATRGDVGEKTSQADKDALSEALKGRHDRIKQWLNECYLEDGTLAETSEAESCFRMLCTFEAEENNGPWWPGAPAWWRDKYEEQCRQRTRERFVEESGGPACPKCGRPLRTAMARQCFSCGARWHDTAT